MRNKFWGLIILAGLLTAAVPMQAHHALQAQYDTTKRGTFTGVLTKFQMVNPHSRWYFDVTNSDGTVSKWEIVAGGVGPLREHGLTRAFVVGDTYKVTYSPSRDGTTTAWAVHIQFKDGRVVTLYDEEFPDPDKK